MREGIHPNYREVVFQDTSSEFKFLARSTIRTNETTVWEDGKTYPLARVEISSASHPFYTGKQLLFGLRRQDRALPQALRQVLLHPWRRILRVAGIGPVSRPPGSTVGGQAVIEGVMMRAPSKWAVAVRRPDGVIEARSDPLPRLSSRSRLARIPFIRGVMVLGESLSLGFRALSWSARKAGDEEAGEELKTGHIVAAMVIALVVFVGFFMLLPLLAARGAEKIFGESTILFNVVDGLVRCSCCSSGTSGRSVGRRTSSGSSSSTEPSTRRFTLTRLVIRSRWTRSRSTARAIPAAAPTSCSS